MSVTPALRTVLSDIDRSQPPSDNTARCGARRSDRNTPLDLSVARYVRVGRAVARDYRYLRRRRVCRRQRTQEIGIRIALGATRRQVVANVMEQGMAMTFGGILLGLVGALMSTRLMTGLLYEVTATDLATFTTAVTIASGTAFGACFKPAVKASLIDPIVALRSD